MVKKARNKKRRAGRIGKVKMPNRSYKFFKPPIYSDKTIGDNWNPRKSPKENLANLGLRSDPIPKIEGSSKGKGNSTSSVCKAIELFDIPESDQLIRSGLSLRMLPVSIENQEYIAPLMKKYGDDYGKMARDIKMNIMQHNTNQLKKIGSRFLLLEESQIRVDVPENVKPMMSCFS